MGRTQAMGMAEAVQDGLIDLENALHYHLTANHYPPIHPIFIETAKEAIAAVNEGDSGREIEMPNGLVRTAGYIVEGLHLESFLDLEVYEDDDGEGW